MSQRQRPGALPKAKHSFALMKPSQGHAIATKNHASDYSEDSSRENQASTDRSIPMHGRDCLQVPHHLDQVGLPISICRNRNQEPMLRDLHCCYTGHERLQRSVRPSVEPLGRRKTGVLGEEDTRSTSLRPKLGLGAVLCSTHIGPILELEPPYRHAGYNTPLKV